MIKAFPTFSIDEKVGKKSRPVMMLLNWGYQFIFSGWVLYPNLILRKLLWLKNDPGEPGCSTTRASLFFNGLLNFLKTSLTKGRPILSIHYFHFD